jgi:ABC-2 type transport system ATP-binding protein
LLVLDELHKAYGDVQALAGASLEVRRGRMLGFLGPNGAGKTTAMRAIFGLIRLDGGSVMWDGRAVSDEDRLRFGYMPEQRGLYPKMKAQGQLAYIGMLHGMERSAASGAAQQWLIELGLGERMQDLVEQLSHGNQQRVQLAAALVHQPDLLVLDEPFSGLDPIGVETMANVLRRRAAEGAAVVFSSHQLDLVEDICEDVAIINRGRVVLAGEVRSLKDRSPYRMLELEMGEDGDRLLENLEGVISASVEGRRHTIVVDAGADVRSLLAEAQAAGDIRHFIYTTPSLSELFKEAVA